LSSNCRACATDFVASGAFTFDQTRRKEFFLNSIRIVERKRSDVCSTRSLEVVEAKNARDFPGERLNVFWSHEFTEGVD
jgi:hypothetical protein